MKVRMTRPIQIKLPKLDRQELMHQKALMMALLQIACGKAELSMAKLLHKVNYLAEHLEDASDDHFIKATMQLYREIGLL